MQIIVMLTPGSYATMMRVTQRGYATRARIVMAVLSCLYVTVIILLGKTIQGGSSLAGPFMLITAGFYLLYAVIMRFVFKYYLTALGDCFFGEMSFETKDDGLHITNDYFHKIFRYQAFSNAVMYGELLILFTGKASGFHLPIAPGKRDAVVAFGYEMRKRIQTASTSPGASSPTTTA